MYINVRQNRVSQYPAHTIICQKNRKLNKFFFSKKEKQHLAHYRKV